MNMKRRLPQYLLGLVVMAVGIVLIKQAGIGISPLSAIPAAVSGISPLTFGSATIIFHFLCVIMQIALMKRLSLKAVLTFPMTVAFGYLIDLLVFLINFGQLSLLARCLVCLAGIVFSALGIVIITGADLMLPAPDAFIRQAHVTFKKPLSLIKTAGDLIWVLITLAIELISSGKVISIGFGTLASVFLTGYFVGLLKKLLPGLQMKATSEK